MGHLFNGLLKMGGKGKLPIQQVAKKRVELGKKQLSVLNTKANT